MDSFKDLYLCEFAETEQESEIRKLAEQYNKETDDYDSLICSGKNEFGEPVPVNDWEHIKINRNAIRVKREILNKNPWVSPGDLNKAIRRSNETR